MMAHGRPAQTDSLCCFYALMGRSPASTARMLRSLRCCRTRLFSLPDITNSTGAAFLSSVYEDLHQCRLTGSHIKPKYDKWLRIPSGTSDVHVSLRPKYLDGIGTHLLVQYLFNPAQVWINPNQVKCDCLKRQEKRLGAMMVLYYVCVVCLFVFGAWLREVLAISATEDAKRLYDDLLRRGDYNRLVRPRPNSTGTLTVVRLGLSLSQIIDVDEKNQIMTTNVWLEQEWYDYKLSWSPHSYGNISTLHVPADEIWLPDIVLYNSADGNFTVQHKTKATLHSSGRVKWRPPAIYQSLCHINVEYFPFDVQRCHLKLGSWTYDGFNVDIRHKRIEEDGDHLRWVEKGIDLAEYYGSTEWDIVDAPAKKYVFKYPCCREPYPDIKFYLEIRRKPLFYTVNLILPCVAICSVTVLVFYIPAKSSEKITMGITILNSLTIFLLLVSQICPPTSIATPLIGKYLLFTMVLVTCSIIVTVFVLNIHFRSPATHIMSPWVRRLFLQLLPKFLLMRPPEPYHQEGCLKTMLTNKSAQKESFKEADCSDDDQVHSPSPDGPRRRAMRDNTPLLSQTHPTGACRDRRVPPAAERAMIGVTFIADHLRQQDEFNKAKGDWQYMARVLDRLFLWLFSCACLLATFGIFLQAPTLQHHRTELGPTRNCSNVGGSMHWCS